MAVAEPDLPDQRDDSTGYRAFFEAHRGYIIAYVLNKRAAYNADVDAVVDVGDVVQETMLAAYMNWTKVRSFEHPRNWLRRVANNKLIDQIRRSVKHEDHRIPADELMADDSTGPPGGLDQVLAKEAMVETLRSLTLPQRDVLTRTIRGLTVAEISDATGLSAEAVYKHRTRARQVIREYYDQSGAGPDTEVHHKPGRGDRRPAGQHPELTRALGGRPRTESDLADAIRIYEQVLSSREKAYGTQHPETRSVRADLARALRSIGRYEQALPLLEQALAYLESRPGETNREIVSARADLADVLRATGRFDRAGSLYEQVLAAQRRDLGTYHPLTLSIQARLARTRQAAGNPTEALTHFEEVTAACERVFGNDHPRTMAVRTDFAEALRAGGLHRRAIPVLMQVLKDQKGNFGDDHPRTLTTCARLADTYRAAGDLHRAIHLFETTLARREKLFGPQHSDTIATRAELAATLHSDKQYARAIPVLRAVLTESEQFLGPEHRESLTTRGLLAEACEATHQFEEALRLFTSNYLLHQQELGRYHLATMRCRIPVVRVLRALGDIDGAIIEQRHVVADNEYRHGADDSATRNAQYDLAQLLETRGSTRHRSFTTPIGNCSDCIGTPCCGGSPPDLDSSETCS